jgi:hypothetical protein
VGALLAGALGVVAWQVGSPPLGYGGPSLLLLASLDQWGLASLLDCCLDTFHSNLWIYL